MGDYSTLATLDMALGVNTASRWLVVLIGNLNMFIGAKNMDDSQTELLARLIAQEYRDMKYSVMQLFFFRFKCGDFGKFYGKVDPMVITCALKDFAAQCESKRQQFASEDSYKRLEEEDTLRKELKSRWYEFRQQLCSVATTDEQREVFGSLDLDFIWFPKKTLVVRVTQAVYNLLEGEYLQFFATEYRKFFTGYSLSYRMVKPEPDADAEAAEVSEPVSLQQKDAVAAKERDAGVRSARAILDNSLHLDKDVLVSMRDAFRKRYGDFPEGYLVRYKNVKVKSE